MVDKDLRLSGKTAIVTGAGSSGPGVGTGKAASILFAREGASVILVDQSESAALQTLASIEQEGGIATVFQGDVTNSHDCSSMVESAIHHYGRLDILFNNVGITGPGSVVDVSEADWDRVMLSLIHI